MAVDPRLVKLLLANVGNKDTSKNTKNIIVGALVASVAGFLIFMGVIITVIYIATNPLKFIASVLGLNKTEAVDMRKEVPYVPADDGINNGIIYVPADETSFIFPMYVENLYDDIDLIDYSQDDKQGGLNLKNNKETNCLIYAIEDGTVVERASHSITIKHSINSVTFYSYYRGLIRVESNRCSGIENTHIHTAECDKTWSCTHTDSSQHNSSCHVTSYNCFEIYNFHSCSELCYSDDIYKGDVIGLASTLHFRISNEDGELVDPYLYIFGDEE